MALHDVKQPLQGLNITPDAELWRFSQPSALPDDQVHLWRASLECDQVRLLAFQHTLASEEQERADRFRFQKDRRHFIAARGALRVILGRYLGIDARQVPIGYSAYGKPILIQAAAPPALQFNLSHSHGVAVFAFSRGRELGVDLECIQPDLATDQLAASFLSPRQIDALRALSPEDRVKTFFSCWTRKEAYVKARGEGFFVDPKQFDVPLEPGTAEAILSHPAHPHETRRWMRIDLEPVPGYIGALVVEGRDWQALRYQF